MKRRKTIMVLLFLMFTLLVYVIEYMVPQQHSSTYERVPQITRAESQQPHTYYIRLDGETPDKCTGLVDAPYPGSGNNQPCAWNHPFHALIPGGTPRLIGGDTLIIASGSYMMGVGAPGDTYCDPFSAWDCHMSPIPGGPDSERPTRILGAGWDAGCTNPPELWGTQRTWLILNLTGSSNVEVACLEITDHSGCVEFHSGGLACERDTYPFGEWAADGIQAADAINITLRDLNIHGLAEVGIRAGRLTDWTVENVRIAANGWAGWDGDIEGEDTNSGTLHFKNWTVEWNGCGESYPGEQPTGCWSQTAGGYGDGVGTGATGGHWIIEDSAFLHNTSDGLDLLYTYETGSLIEIKRTIAEGNAGDQIKTSGASYMENVIAVSNCGFFSGQTFTYNVDNCRAGGSALALNPRAGESITITNATLTGQGDCLIIAECAGETECDGTEKVYLHNTIFQGNPEFDGGGDTTCFVWDDLPAEDPYHVDYAIINGLKAMPGTCPDGSFCNIAPQLVNASIDNFDAHLLSSSPAINNGNPEDAATNDFDGSPRDTQPDIGAYEYANTLPPQVEFSAQPRYGPPPLEVKFTDLSTGEITSWQWDFGDATTATIQNPTHIYEITRAYTVTLTVVGPMGTDTMQKAKYISVYEPIPIYLPLVLRMS